MGADKLTGLIIPGPSDYSTAENTALPYPLAIFLPRLITFNRWPSPAVFFSTILVILSIAARVGEGRIKE